MIPEGARKETELVYHYKIVSIVEIHNIPHSMIVNLDQTPSKYMQIEIEMVGVLCFSLEMKKAIINRSRLRNLVLKKQRWRKSKTICKQRNKCDSLLRKSKKDYFENLNENNITDNKRFWKTVKPFLSKKIRLPERATLTEEENNSLLTLWRSCRRTK